jgi:signal transduction histidine kinase
MLGPIEDLILKESGNRIVNQLELIHRNALRLLKLVNTLLDFSRIESGRMDAFFEATDFSRVTKDLASIFRSACERAGINKNRK